MSTTTPRSMVLNQAAAGVSAHDILREHLTNVTGTTAVAILAAINEHEVTVAKNELLRSELLEVIRRERSMSENGANGSVGQVITHNGEPMTADGQPVTIQQVQAVGPRQPTIPAPVAPAAAPPLPAEIQEIIDNRLTQPSQAPRIISGSNLLVELQDSIDTIVRALTGVQQTLNQVRADIAADRIILR